MIADFLCPNCGPEEGDTHGDCTRCGLQLVRLRPEQRMPTGIEKEFGLERKETCQNSSS